MIGIISALGAAVSWTYACSLWRSQTNFNKPIDINLLKNLFAFIVFIPALSSISIFLEYKYIIFLLTSGVIGIGLGDSFYLKSLQLIGTRKTLSIEALSPLIAALAGEVLINENLSLKSWAGIVIVSISLIAIIIKQNYLVDKDANFQPSSNSISNFLYPLLSVICAVFAAFLSRLVFIETDFHPIQTTEIRLLGAIIFLVIFQKFKVNFFIFKLNRNERFKFIFSILLGTNLGIFLQQIVFKNLPLGIGWTLLSTSPIISLFLAKKEEGFISKNTIYATISLFIGIVLIIL